VGSTKFVVVKAKELAKTAVFAILGVIIIVGLITFFLHMGDDENTGMYRDGTYYGEMETGGERTLSVKDALKLIYCLMAVDGSISPEEEETFREIGTNLDPDFQQWKDELIADLSMKEAVLSDGDEYFDFIHDYMAEILYKAEDTGEGIDAKTLIWDLLVMAFSEGDYSANERRLIRVAAKALNIDSAIPLEMEQTLRTITALNKEEEWLKSVNRSYSVVAEQIDELKERRETIMTGVHALMED
jgi:uncharacterized tellurite resistance protein B-like protein